MLNILFITSAVAFTFGQFARTQLSNGIALTLLDLSLAFFVAYGLVDFIRRKKPDRFLLIPILAFFAVCAVSLLFQTTILQSQQIFVSALYGLRWLVYAAIYIVIRDSKKSFKSDLKRYMFIAGGAVVFLGYVQYFLYNNLGNLYYLEWDDHLYRMFSVFLDPNFAGVFFCLYLFFVIPYVVEAYRVKDRSKILFFGAISFFTLLAVILTYSRTAFVVLLVGIITLLLIKVHKSMIIGFLVIALGLFIVFSDIGVEGRNPFRSVSTLDRIRSVQIAAEIIQKNPVFGVGFNAYRYAQNRYGYRASGRWQVSHADAGTDNSYLFVMATTGLVGFSAYIFLWYRIIRKAKMASPSDQLFLYPTLAGLLVSAFFLNTLFYPMLLYWFWVVLGITEST